MIESNNQEWGLCDHFPLALEIDDDDAEADYGDAWDEFDEQDDDDDEWPMAHMAVWRPTSRPAAPRCREAGNSTGQAQASWCGPLPRADGMPLP